MPAIGVFYFRRDLRLPDNLGLTALAARCPSVLPVFCLDPRQLCPRTNPYFSPRCVQFMLEALADLDAQLRRHNASGTTASTSKSMSADTKAAAPSGLVVLPGVPEDVLPRLIRAVQTEGRPVLGFNADFTPFAVERDRRVVAAVSATAPCSQNGKPNADECDSQGAGAECIVTHGGATLAPTDGVVTGTGRPYRVFTPYYNNVRAKGVPVPDYSLFRSDGSAATAGSASPTFIGVEALEGEVKTAANGTTSGELDQTVRCGAVVGTVAAALPCGLSVLDARSLRLDPVVAMDATAPATSRQPDDASRHGSQEADAAVRAPPGGRAAGLARLSKQALVARAAAYTTSRDVLATDGTTGMSAYMKFGCVSPREVVALCRQHLKKSEAEAIERQVLWAQFSANVTKNFPHVLAGQLGAFNRTSTGADGTTCRNLELQEALHIRVDALWVSTAEGSAGADALARWKAGTTGYPVVDAAMRQLLATGWVHNRGRMVAASFLTKHLQIDWREGERHFAQHLVDYEPSNNSAGWQWAASTGADAQPYFRVFNPWAQATKFDPEALYVRRYVPELRGVPVADLLRWEKPAVRAQHRACGYPEPIVEHAAARKASLDSWKALPSIDEDKASVAAGKRPRP